MYQNTCVDFKLGYLDAKSDAIAFSVKTQAYPSSSFIKNRSNIHEMQNRMKIAFCVKPPLPSILLADKGLFALNAILVRFIVARNFIRFLT